MITRVKQIECYYPTCACAEGKKYGGDVSVVAACISYNHNCSNVTLCAIKAINSLSIECELGTSY